MRVFGLTTGADTGGINIRIAQAFGQHTDWDVRSMVTSVNYLAYPRDLDWSQSVMERQYDAADVVHLHNSLHAHRWYDAEQGKPIVLEHHSRHGLRDNADEAKAIGAVQVGSTLDLGILNPDVTWTPPPYDLAALRAIRAAYRPSERIRVAHAPTNRDVKGTETFLAVVADLAKDGLPIEADLIEGVTWTECLRRKAQADIVYDQMVLGYGLNTVEAWAMGIPVIAGVADAGLRRAMAAGWGGTPYVEATTPLQLRNRLATLVRSARAREEASRRGTEHVERWHDERNVVAQLRPIYETAQATVPGGSLRRVLPVRRAA